MNYKKGGILTYDFPPRLIEEIENNKTIKNYKKSNVINDYHRVIILHTRTTPYNIILVAPITSADKLALKNKIPENYVKLNQADYPGVLDKDSFINLDMIMPVDEEELQQLERYNKKFKADLNADDLYKLDYKIALTYELQAYLATEVDKDLKQEFANIVEYIDVDIREKVTEIIRRIQDPEICELLLEIIDNDLVGVLSSTYLKK